MLREFVSSYFAGLQQCFGELSAEKLEQVVQILRDAQRAGRTIYVLGNGGSASTSSHMAVDLGKGTSKNARPRLRMVSLADNIGLITAWANDVNYEEVFSQQLENLLRPGDVVIAISASGNSPNVLRAVKQANEKKATTIGFIGFGGGKLKDLVQVDLTVSSRNYGQVEDFHLSLNHILSQYLTEDFDSPPGTGSSSTKGEKTNGILQFTFSTPPSTGLRPAILLDRDGIINERIHHGYVTRWDEFRFVAGIRDAIAALAELSLPIIVVSNQAGVDKGLVGGASLCDLTKRFVTELRNSGGRIDAVYYCQHTPEENCACRKPRTGLLTRAAMDWRLDLSRSVLIGDSANDLEAARTANCMSIFLVSEGNHESPTVAELGHMADVTIRSAAEIPKSVHQLLGPEGRKAQPCPPVTRAKQ